MRHARLLTAQAAPVPRRQCQSSTAKPSLHSQARSTNRSACGCSVHTYLLRTHVLEHPPSSEPPSHAPRAAWCLHLSSQPVNCQLAGPHARTFSRQWPRQSRRPHRWLRHTRRPCSVPWWRPNGRREATERAYVASSWGRVASAAARRPGEMRRKQPQGQYALPRVIYTPRVWQG